MAGKLPRADDRGRCSRCRLSVKVPHKGTNGESRFHWECSKYGDWCKRVAWNCSRVVVGNEKRRKK